MRYKQTIETNLAAATQQIEVLIRLLSDNKPVTNSDLIEKLMRSLNQLRVVEEYVTMEQQD